MNKKPEHVSEVVTSALTRYNTQHPQNHVTVDELKWDHLNGCYYFERAGMYHGVELDGTIHT